MHCMKLLGQRLMARDFDRQVAEVQVRVAILNGYTALEGPTDLGLAVNLTQVGGGLLAEIIDAGLGVLVESGHLKNHGGVEPSVIQDTDTLHLFDLEGKKMVL